LKDVVGANIRSSPKKTQEDRMKQTKNTKKLNLNKETVNNLDTNLASRAQLEVKGGSILMSITNPPIYCN